MEMDREICPKWKLKNCPKCGGDQYLDYDEYACLQCGYTEPVNIDDVLQKQVG